MEFSRLLLPAHLLLFYLAAVLALAAAADVPALPGPGCATRCGYIDVPYPFGLDPQCAIDGFQLNCTIVGGNTKLFYYNVEVIKISVPNGKIWLKNWISRQCYNQTTNQLDVYTSWMNLNSSPFVLSAKDNKMISIGCRSYPFVVTDSYIIGCLSTCDDKAPKNGSCSGAGCCQADLSRSTRTFRGDFYTDYNTSKIWRQTPCNYVVLMENAAFSFSTTYLTMPASFDIENARVPVVADWAITQNTCEEAKINKTYACVSKHSDCVTNEEGYRCSCSIGYEGNPYIIDGCKDIDECKDNVTYPCPGICENIPGNYTCSCPRGKHMMKDACIPDQKSIWVTPVVGASVGFVVLVIAIASAYLIQEKRKLHRIKQKYFRQHGGMLLFEEMKSKQGIVFKIFSEEELQQATNRFDEQQVIGHGGHGKVYKGSLKSDVEIAVKRCMTINEQQKKEFGKEMLILSQINHKNIVKLLGCCLEVEVPMLVYEFIPNGTLFHLIHGDRGQHISLATRLRIAYESAEALAYLHSCASPPIIHGDVKYTNILLDGDYIVKV